MIAYLDCPSGISGDMFLGCLVDAGWTLDALRATVNRLGLPDNTWSVRQETVQRGPLRATLVTVEAAEGDRHRHLHDVREIIERASLPVTVVRQAISVFTRLAEAEANVHGTSVEAVHFHEVGAIDAIIDIVGVCAGLHALGIERLFASAVPLGEGWATTAHGRIPLPAPATLALLAKAGAPTRAAPGSGELVTPTGAALLAEFAVFEQPSIRLRRIGLGAGRKEFTWPNVARLWLGEVDRGDGNRLDAVHEAMVQIETNIDDMNPELYAFVSNRLFDQGAVDVWMTSIQMKKGRPGVLLTVLGPANLERTLADTLLRETTTLGVRVHHLERYAVPRELRRVETVYGSVQVKLKWVNSELSGVKPEYEECVRLAQEQNVPARLVYEAAMAAAHQAFMSDQAVAIADGRQGRAVVAS